MLSTAQKEERQEQKEAKREQRQDLQEEELRQQLQGERGRKTAEQLIQGKAQGQMDALRDLVHRCTWTMLAPSRHPAGGDIKEASQLHSHGAWEFFC